MMQQITHQKLSGYPKLIIALALVCGAAFFGASNAAAQEPTSIPTATPAPTWTPVPGATATPVPGQPTPTRQATPSGREIDLRPSDDEFDINYNDCVLFNWLVRGDYVKVEFDQLDDGGDPILVSAMDERLECPTKERTKYRLIVSWSTGEISEETREVRISDDDDGDSGSSGGSSGSGGSGSVPEPGNFVVVTPILITSSVLYGPATATPVPTEAAIANANFVDSTVLQPSGILATVQELPETGRAAAAPPAGDWLNWALLLGSIAAGLAWLVKVSRP